MNIFCDFHHSGLGYSLHLLLEKRLGHKLYFPIGEEWFDKDYWYIAKPYGDSPDTIHQYLKTDENQNKQTHYEIPDAAHDYIRKALTWDQFQSMDIDIIIASIPDHYRIYRKLRDIYKPNAKVICQMGNMFDEIQDLMNEAMVENLLASTIEIPTRNWIHSLFYHQEIDTSVFKWIEPTIPVKKISSFVNLLPQSETYFAYKQALPEYDFKAYGALTPDGTMHTIREVAEEMGRSNFAYHVKPRGDGFGHVLYDWAFIGRPILTNFSDYKNKLGGELLEHNVTAIDLERGNIQTNAELIKHYSTPGRYYQMCMNMRNRIEQCVNYSQETRKVKNFLENLK